MLLIGDIHITSKRQDAIIAAIRNFVDQNKDENNIVFLGDYVYHFTYDRKALLSLFSLFVDLYKEGKNIWVLAGNHDWIHEHFVFAEGKWSFDLMDLGEGKGSLNFITEPCFRSIEGQDILFFPFTKFDGSIIPVDNFSDLCTDEHINIQQSGRANSLLSTMIDQWREKKSDNKLNIFHHRYIVNTIFPGQQARFSFKSPGLSNSRLDVDDIILFSGHLHQAFGFKNYCCIGSVRSSSPLETNQIKYLYTRDGKSLIASPIAINPYLTLEIEDSAVSLDLLNQSRHNICNDSFKYLTEGDISVSLGSEFPELPVSDSSIYFRGGGLSYDSLPDIVDPEVLQSVRDYKIKQSRKSVDATLESLEDSSLQLDERISDRKTLLKRFLQAKYADKYEEYLDLLEELEILS